MAQMTAGAATSAAATSTAAVGITLAGYDPVLPYDLPAPYDGGGMGASMGAG